MKLRRRRITLEQLTEMLRQEGWIALDETVHDIEVKGFGYSKADPRRLEILFDGEAF